jgi:hypothetical protein
VLGRAEVCQVARPRTLNVSRETLRVAIGYVSPGVRSPSLVMVSTVGRVDDHTPRPDLPRTGSSSP